MTGIILMMIQGGFGLLGLLGLLGIAGLVGGGFLAFSLLFALVIVGADAWAVFVYFKDKEAHAWISGAPSAPQQPGYPPHQQGTYPPPPPGYQPGQQGQPGQQSRPGQPGQPGQHGQPGQQPPYPPQPPYGR